MAGCVGADLELLSYGLVRSTLSQEYGHLDFPASKSVLLDEATLASLVASGSRRASGLLSAQVTPELTQLVYRAPQPVHQHPIVVPQICERGKKIHQAIGREGRWKPAICTRPGRFIVHGKSLVLRVLSPRLFLHPEDPA